MGKSAVSDCAYALAGERERVGRTLISCLKKRERKFSNDLAFLRDVLRGRRDRSISQTGKRKRRKEREHFFISPEGVFCLGEQVGSIWRVGEEKRADPCVNAPKEREARLTFLTGEAGGYLLFRGGGEKAPRFRGDLQYPLGVCRGLPQEELCINSGKPLYFFRRGDGSPFAGQIRKKGLSSFLLKKRSGERRDALSPFSQRNVHFAKGKKGWPHLGD